MQRWQWRGQYLYILSAFPDEMLTYLQDGHKLDEFTYKKSLQKITESYRVDKEMKKIIKEMRQRG